MNLTLVLISGYILVSVESCSWMAQQQLYEGICPVIYDIYNYGISENNRLNYNWLGQSYPVAYYKKADFLCQCTLQLSENWKTQSQMLHIWFYMEYLTKETCFKGIPPNKCLHVLNKFIIDLKYNWLDASTICKEYKLTYYTTHCFQVLSMIANENIQPATFNDTKHDLVNCIKCVKYISGTCDDEKFKYLKALSGMIQKRNKFNRSNIHNECAAIWMDKQLGELKNNEQKFDLINLLLSTNGLIGISGPESFTLSRNLEYFICVKNVHGIVYPYYLASLYETQIPDRSITIEQVFLRTLCVEKVFSPLKDIEIIFKCYGFKDGQKILLTAANYKFTLELLLKLHNVNYPVNNKYRIWERQEKITGLLSLIDVIKDGAEKLDKTLSVKNRLHMFYHNIFKPIFEAIKDFSNEIAVKKT